MATLFSMILAGDLPGRFVHRDERCGAFLTIAPIRPGHTLVVPTVEVDQWTDLDDDVAAHLMVVARRIGAAQRRVFACERVGLIVAGFEVPHVHLHVIPTRHMGDLDFANADPAPDAAALDDAAQRLRDALDHG